jgi:hypothetical protein
MTTTKESGSQAERTCTRYISLEVMLEGIRLMLAREIGLDSEFEMFYGWLANRLKSGPQMANEFYNWQPILDICNYARASVVLREMRLEQRGEANLEGPASITVFASPDQGVMISWTVQKYGEPQRITWDYRFDSVRSPKMVWPKNWLDPLEAVRAFADRFRWPLPSS